MIRELLTSKFGNTAAVFPLSRRGCFACVLTHAKTVDLYTGGVVDSLLPQPHPTLIETTLIIVKEFIGAVERA